MNTPYIFHVFGSVVTKVHGYDESKRRLSVTFDDGGDRVEEIPVEALRSDAGLQAIIEAGRKANEEREVAA